MARPGLEKHVKFKKLVRMLGEPKPHVRGYLETLWDVAYECGDAVIGDAEAIEAAAEYPGEPGKLFKALLSCGGQRRTTADNGSQCPTGFIEEAENTPGIYQIHDLFDHAPDYVKKRQQRENERKSNRIGKNGGQRRTTADNGAPPAPAPTPTPMVDKSDQIQFDQKSSDRIAADLFQRAGTPQADALPWQVAMLVVAGKLPEGLAVDAAQAVRECGAGKPWAYFRKCLAEGCSKRGINLRALLPLVNLPRGFDANPPIASKGNLKVPHIKGPHDA